MYKVSYIVEGISGGHGDFSRSFNSFRDALSCFIRQGYADNVNTGCVRVRVEPLDNEACVFSQNVCSFSSTVCAHDFPSSIFGGVSHE